VERRADERTEHRRPGKQPGAPGAHLAQVATPDEVAWHVPDRCGGCGAELTDASVVGVEARQVFDLPPLGLRVTEHRAERCRCACGMTTAGRFPEHARAAACYGPGVRALVAYLCVHQHLPVDRAAQLLATARSMRTLASLRVGDRVQINHNAKPNYLHGRAGTVTGWAGQNVVIQLDQPVGRFTPASCAAHHSSSNHWHLNSYPRRPRRPIRARRPGRAPRADPDGDTRLQAARRTVEEREPRDHGHLKAEVEAYVVGRAGA
jgi:transposase